MDESISDVVILGGGDAGLLTGLSINKLNSDLDIRIIDDFQETNPQVGKSTFARIVEILHDFLELNQREFVEEVRPIWKASIYFKDWCGYAPFHLPFDHWEVYPEGGKQEDAGERYYHLYKNVLNSSDHRTNNELMVEQKKTPFYFGPDGNMDNYHSFAYHLNTKRFNQYLRDKCEERGVRLINDQIIKVENNGNYIENLQSADQVYTADLYIDASGFRRVLKQNVENTFIDFDIPLDSAFNVRIDRSLSEIIPATIIETGDYGWYWHIDTYDNRDLGYVFASDFVSNDEAISEFIAHSDGAFTEEDTALYEFTSGYHESAWVGNCVSIGNAEGFVEPLQSTGLTANAEAAVNLSILLASHDKRNHPGIRETYNLWVQNLWDSIYDFISIHYKYADGENDFWKSMQSIDLSERSNQIIDSYGQNGLALDVNPLEHKQEINSPTVFSVHSFYSMMRYMNVDSPYYEDNHFEVSDSIKDDYINDFEKMKNKVDLYLSIEEFYKGFIGV